MKTAEAPDHLKFKTTTPPSGIDIIVGAGKKGKAHVSIRDGVAYLWKYHDTDEVFCSVSEITGWRGCGGFDY